MPVAGIAFAGDRGCGNPDCHKLHGPYFYAYWKQDKKLKKRYVGKHLEDFRLRKIAKQIKLKPSLLIKFKFIEEQANKGNVLDGTRRIRCKQ